MSLIGPLKRSKEESSCSYHLHIWIDQGARIHGEKVKSDIESVKVVMQEVRYKLSLCSNIRTSLQNRMYHNLWNISFSVLSS